MVDALRLVRERELVYVDGLSVQQVENDIDLSLSCRSKIPVNNVAPDTAQQPRHVEGRADVCVEGKKRIIAQLFC